MKRKQEVFSFLDHVDAYGILRDLLRNLYAILLGAAALAMIMNMYLHASQGRTYSTTATIVVSSKTASSTTGGLSEASSMAGGLVNILNSDLMKNRVLEELGLRGAGTELKAGVISGTNLMTLSVTADSPYDSYRIIRAAMDDMYGMTAYVSNDMVLDVLQPPAVPTRADVSSATMRRTLQVFFLGAALFAAAFAGLSYRKPTIKSEADMEEKLDARSLGALCEEGNGNVLRNLLRRKKNRPLITELTAGFRFVERVRKIGAALAKAAEGRGSTAILVTSACEHEGKTTLSANIALTLAQQGGKVLLIDGDLRRPSLHGLLQPLNAERKAGLSDLLTGRASLNEVILEDEKLGISCLLNRQGEADSTDIVSSAQMARLIEGAKKYFDYIVIDSPPMTQMADAEALAQVADLSVLVVGYDMVPARELNDAIDTLRACRAEFVGCILNRMRALPGADRTRSGHAYRYYSGYGATARGKSYGRYGDRSGDRFGDR